MLLAHLKGKFGRLLVRGLGDDAEGGAAREWRDLVREDEDTLTAVVFGRLRYLRPSILSWVFSGPALGDRGDLVLPGRSRVEFCFWHRYESASSVAGDRVEPDVVLEFQEEQRAIVVEVKHHSRHTAEQWVSEIAAVGHALESRGRGDWRVDFLAVEGTGGSVPDLSAVVDEARRQGVEGMVSPSMVRVMPWEDLVERISVGTGDLSDQERTVLRDIRDALEDRGYRVRQGLESLGHVGVGSWDCPPFGGARVARPRP